ncbi:MAG: hypothetical protein LBD13_03325 [Spirochaetaceae bacterium]|jgi:hypothetical protein|nr:hypothetical protein [Spirochaetaceae bacterium]
MECYVENVSIIIKDWKTLKNITKKLDKNIEEIISNKYREHEIIQEIENKNRTIIFKGFSKDDGHWMENIFEECIIEIK